MVTKTSGTLWSSARQMKSLLSHTEELGFQGSAVWRVDIFISEIGIIHFYTSELTQHAESSMNFQGLACLKPKLYCVSQVSQEKQYKAHS